MHQHFPPRWHHSSPARTPGAEHKRRMVRRRFGALFGGLSLLYALTLGVILIILITGQEPSRFHFPGWIVPFICVIPLIFLLLSGLIVSWSLRRIGTPIADVMAAADAVAKGDLNVRLREDVPGEFGQLATSFNRMTSELERAEQQRRNMTADIAHELRTPLHLIQGNLEGILDGVYQPDSETLTATLEETRLLSRLVTDLQTLTLAESGQLPLHLENFSAVDLLSDVATSFAGQAAEQSIELKVDVPETAAAATLFADPDRMDQVLSNLVANALRYTPAGGKITLRIRPKQDEVCLQVEDSGAGISPDDLPYIFDRFWRADRARTRSSGAGSGLGLAIARQLVQAQGGTIQAESQPEKGTVFTITFPHKEKA